MSHRWQLDDLHMGMLGLVCAMDAPFLRFFQFIHSPRRRSTATSIAWRSVCSNGLGKPTALDSAFKLLSFSAVSDACCQAATSSRCLLWVFCLFFVLCVCFCSFVSVLCFLSFGPDKTSDCVMVRTPLSIPQGGTLNMHLNNSFISTTMCDGLAKATAAQDGKKKPVARLLQQPVLRHLRSGQCQDPCPKLSASCLESAKAAKRTTF